MVEKAEVKAEALLNLDDLLQCPVCYEIPSGQIFQCNEGHHVCGRCKVRLDVCPVCRALFFGTRNYAMEELISNFKKLKALKSGGTATAGSSESSTPPKDKSTEDTENVSNEEEENDVAPTNVRVLRAPQACKGLFRCLCCKNGNNERLPAARLLNHLRYFHRPDLLEGRTENGEYLQAWQIATTPGRLVTAVRIADMGIFFLVIEISSDAVCAWLSMATSPWIAHTFNYTITICGNDREAIFSDCVWSVRACEGTLKKRGHCLMVTNLDAQALVAPATISTKLSIRRTPEDQIANQTAAQPRAVLRIANRVNNERVTNFEPFLQEFTNDVTRLFANLDREANALVRSEREIRARIENELYQPVPDRQPVIDVEAMQPLSRNARRRMRLRLRMALNELADVDPVRPPPAVTRPILAATARRYLVTQPPPQIAARSMPATAPRPTPVNAPRSIPACTARPNPACTARPIQARPARPADCVNRSTPACGARPISAGVARPNPACTARPTSAATAPHTSATIARPTPAAAARPMSASSLRPMSTGVGQPQPNQGTQRGAVFIQTHNTNGFRQEDNQTPTRQAALDNAPPVAPPTASGPSNARPQNGNRSQNTNRSQKKRRNRR